jgi:hypothetical protein
MKQKSGGGVSEGAILMFKDQCYLFNGISQNQFSGDQMVVRFTELKTGKDTDVPCSCNAAAKRIEFDVPASLKNETLYEMSLVRKYGKGLVAASAPSVEDKYIDQLGNELEEGNGMANMALNMGVNNNNNTYNGLYTLQKTISDGASTSKKNYEKKLYNNHFFGTSKYNTMKQKWQSYSVKKVAYWKTGMYYSYQVNGMGYTTSDQFNNPVVLLQGGERFDQYDLYGYSTNGISDLDEHEEPAILQALGEDSGWEKEMKDKHYSFLTLPAGPIRSYLVGHHGSSVVYRPDGFPFYGHADNMFYSNYEMVFMRNYAYYEQKMHQDGSLGASESLLRPSGPLTMAEINAAMQNQGGGGMILNLGLNNGNQGGNGMGLNLNLNSGGQAYFPVMDMKNYVTHLDKYNVDTRILSKAKTVSNSHFVQCFNTLKSLGWPSMPKRSFPLSIKEREYKDINGSQYNLVRSYMYMNTRN